MAKKKKKKSKKIKRSNVSRTPRVGVESVEKKVQKEDRYALPIREIKRDLVKIILFAILAIVSLVVLKATGFTFRF